MEHVRENQTKTIATTITTLTTISDNILATVTRITAVIISLTLSLAVPGCDKEGFQTLDLSSQRFQLQLT
jgi:hypothetical protein